MFQRDMTIRQDSVIVSCARCGAKNRIPKIRMQEGPLYGECRARIVPGAYFDRPITISDDTFSNSSSRGCLF